MTSPPAPAASLGSGMPASLGRLLRDDLAFGRGQLGRSRFARLGLLAGRGGERAETVRAPNTAGHLLALRGGVGDDTGTLRERVLVARQGTVAEGRLVEVARLCGFGPQRGNLLVGEVRVRHVEILVLASKHSQ